MKLSIIVRRLLLTIRTAASIICLTAPTVEAQCTAYGDPPATLIANIVPLCSRGTRLGPWNDADGTPRYACLYEPEAASASAPLPLLVFLHPWVMTRKTAAVGLQITGWIVLTLALAVISTGSAAAQVKPRDFISAEDPIRVQRPDFTGSLLARAKRLDDENPAERSTRSTAPAPTYSRDFRDSAICRRGTGPRRSVGTSTWVRSRWMTSQ